MRLGFQKFLLGLLNYFRNWASFFRSGFTTSDILQKSSFKQSFINLYFRLLVRCNVLIKNSNILLFLVISVLISGTITPAFAIHEHDATSIADGTISVLGTLTNGTTGQFEIVERNIILGDVDADDGNINLHGTTVTNATKVLGILTADGTITSTDNAIDLGDADDVLTLVAPLTNGPPF